jgi:hypothetical protein
MGHLGRRMSQSRSRCLVLLVSVDFSLLRSAGKSYPWERPPCCRRCQGLRLWGHGYVARYFDGEPGRLWMKRWRCPDCGAVYTMRPSTHWRGFLSPWWLILASLLQKVVQGRWLSVAGRQRQQYWRRGYLKQRQVSGGLAGVEELHDAGIIVATHSLTDRQIQRFPYCANLAFAATGAPEGG